MKVLFFVARWSNGGIEKNICNYLNMLVEHNIRVYIAALVKDGDLFDDVLEKHNISIMLPNENITNNRKKAEFLREACKKTMPDIVHINISCGVAFMYAHEIKSKFPKIKTIVHGHSTNTEPPYIFLKNLYYGIFRVLWENSADYALACSAEAGRYLYSNQRRNSSSYTVLHCAIDTGKFVFSSQDRHLTRKNLNLDDKAIVIGTIGRFDTQKNPFFILEIIDGLKKSGIDFKFLWIGEGVLRKNIEDEVERRNLCSRVIFIDKTTNVAGMLSSMDIFILPSLYEGLSIVNIEAQASGLFNLVSDTISDEAKISEKFIQLPIKDSSVWVDKIENILHCNNYLERVYPEENIQRVGFDIKSNTEYLITLYKNIVGNDEVK